ncbi:MAG TPA: SEC-C metal-binding domain-containing protein, partial [Chiayiivirga sp.]|nr:SEC-C metal-binding domain-containing protein [Chiayiivirga sp.]
FDIRKQLLEYDDVANDQRKVIYAQRSELMESESVQEVVTEIRQDVVAGIVARFVPPDSVDEMWNLAGLEKEVLTEFGVGMDLQKLVREQEEIDSAGIAEHVQEAFDRLFREKEAMIGSEMMRTLERHVMLTVLDQSWKEHLARMDFLRQGIHLRGYAQKQPKQEYKREAFEMFGQLLDKIRLEVVRLLALVRIRSEDEVAQMEEAERQRSAAQARSMQFQHEDVGGLGADEEAAQVTGQPQPPVQVVREHPKVGRNEPCPCGSGKKFKHCHGQLA